MFSKRSALAGQAASLFLDDLSVPFHAIVPVPLIKCSSWWSRLSDPVSSSRAFCVGRSVGLLITNCNKEDALLGPVMISK